jgi:hypothetical protein
VGIEEEGVGAPGVGLDAPVQVLIPGYFGEVAVVLFADVCSVCGVFSLDVVHPRNADSD